MTIALRCLDDSRRHSAATRDTLVRRRRATPRACSKSARLARAPHDGVAALSLRAEGVRVAFIAETQAARSPRRACCAIRTTRPAIVREYADAGAAAASVLTEPDFFSGAPAHLQRRAKPHPTPAAAQGLRRRPLPARTRPARGAPTCVLLIVAALDRAPLHDLLDAAKALGLTVLVEVHALRELDRFEVDRTPIIGVNHRDLRTFEVDLGKSPEVFRVLPPRSSAWPRAGSRTPPPSPTSPRAAPTPCSSARRSCASRRRERRYVRCATTCTRCSARLPDQTRPSGYTPHRCADPRRCKQP